MKRPRWALVVVFAIVLLAAGCSAVVPQAPSPHAKARKPGPVQSFAPASITLHSETGTPISVPHGGGVPRRFTIWADPFEAKWIGTTSVGDQFYFGEQAELTPGTSDLYDVLFVWSSTGAFKSATIDDLGPKPSAAQEDAARETRLSTLGSFRRTTLHVAPFGVKAFGIDFGFIPVPPDSDDPSDGVSIELLPMNNMAFYAPWSYGHYDT